VYRLHALEGRSYEEVSARLRIPKATVGTRLIRARRKLRDLLMPPAAAMPDFLS
jgi:RNA polymerase sigma-70 factor, ECF subfamily